MTSLGTGIAFLGAILAVGLACAGSGRCSFACAPG